MQESETVDFNNLTDMPLSELTGYTQVIPTMEGTWCLEDFEGTTLTIGGVI